MCVLCEFYGLAQSGQAQARSDGPVREARGHSGLKCGVLGEDFGKGPEGLVNPAGKCECVQGGGETSLVGLGTGLVWPNVRLGERNPRFWGGAAKTLERVEGRVWGLQTSWPKE